MSATFKNRVSQFTTSLLLTNNEKISLTKEVVKFVLQLHGQQRSTVLRKKAFALGCLEETTHFKNQFLDVSEYIHTDLWKNVRDRLDTEDVQFCLKHLTPKELKAIDDLKYPGTDTSNFDLNQWITDKIKYLKSKTYKLRFIKEYDPSFDTDDFVQELACEAVRVVRTFGRSKAKGNPNDTLKIQLEKYIEGALNNKIRSFIEYHTSGTRRRAVSTNEKLYKKLKTVKKHLNLVKRSHQTYVEGVVETRLMTLKWYGAERYITKKTLVEKFPEKVVENFKDDLVITHDQLKKVLLQYPFEMADVSAFEQKVSLVQNDIKKTDGDYFAKTLSFDTTAEMNYELDDSGDSPDNKIWLDQFSYKVKDPRDNEYLALVLGDAEEKLENDFVAWANKNQKSRNIRNFNTRYQLAQKFVGEKYQGWRNNLRIKPAIRGMFDNHENQRA